MSTRSFFPVPVTTLDPQSQLRLGRLLFARLALTVVGFAIAIGLDVLGHELAPFARRGLYLTVVVSFGVTILSAALLRRTRRVDRFASLQIAVDVGIVSSLVHFSGGRDSVFVFLFVVVTLYAAVLFERRGAMMSASLSAVAHGLILLEGRLGLTAGGIEEDTAALPILAAIWAVHVGALYLVGVLASLLSAELYRTGRALDQRTSDLRVLQGLHQRMVESIMSGLLTTDGDDVITSFNPEAERITGISGRLAVGRPVEDIIPGTTELSVGSEPASASGQTSRSRLSFVNQRGEEMVLGLASSVLKESKGQAQGHVVIFQDVTDVVRMEGELRRSERLAAVGEMAAKIAHEIRNPLASISGSIQILRSGGHAETDEEENRKLTEIVIRETERLDNLITNFLQYSRPPAPTIERVEIDTLLDGLAKMLDSIRPDHIEIDIQSPPGASLRADPDQLRQVLWNLANNAIQAMPDGGRLEISAGAAPDLPAQDGAASRRNEQGGAGSSEDAGRLSMEIVLRDDGEGMSEELQERIFEPFFTTKKEGSGLGLATVDRIIESHGGALLVESREGVGTTFRVRLPGSEAGA